MEQVQRDEIGQALTKAALFYGHEIDKTRISMLINVMVESWPEASGETILKAIQAYRSDSKNTVFPFPAKLMPYVRPTVTTDTLAQEITGKIVQSIGHYGYMHSQDARAYIGEHGWAVVESSGGWAYLCANHGLSINPGTFYAQTVKAVQAKLEIAKTGQSVDNLLEHHVKPQIEEPKVKGLIERLAEKKSMPVEGAE